jgi:hypothetical protein
MNKLWITAVALAVTASAQPSLAPPRLGFVEDSASALRPVYGITGNFILGPSIAGKIASEAFSGCLGLMKTDSLISAFDPQGNLLASIDAAPGPALFAFSPDGETGLAYIASSQSLIEWRGDSFAPVSTGYQIPTGDAVLAIAFPDPFEASLILRRNARDAKGDLWEVNVPLGAAGTLSQSALNGVHAPVISLPSGELVYSDGHGIVVRATDASEVHIPASLPARFSLQQMNQDWVQLTDLDGPARFAIHTTPGRESVYQLPGGQQ